MTYTMTTEQEQPSVVYTLNDPDNAYEKFPILTQINLPAVRHLASNIRMSIDGAQTPIPCKFSPDINHGTFNVILELVFEDGVCWIFKVPVNGFAEKFKSLNQNNLLSEVRIMRMIKAKTEIPVPALYAFNGSPHNDTGVPFIMMEKIEGKPAHEG